jgi:hypothetical protein
MLGLFLSFLLWAVPTQARPIACESYQEDSLPSCHFRSCLLPPNEAYGRPSLVLYPLNPTPTLPIRVHLHGWTQDHGQPRNEDYDFAWPDEMTNPTLSELEKFWSAYGLYQGPCAPQPEITVIPLSRGHNDDHLKYFINPIAFNQYFDLIAAELHAIQPSLTEIHLSAHSGGGKILSQILNPKNPRINRIKVFDGVYHSSTSDQLNRWLREDHEKKRVLELYSVTENTYSLSREISFQGVKTLDSTGSILWIRDSKTSLRFEWILDGSVDHYELVPNRFADHGWSLK